LIKETLHIANVKCSGCAHSITTRINSITGVTDVDVNIENRTIDVNYENEDQRSQVINKLSAMGYPEATEENGLLMQAKSYANCMIGKISK
jgi:copper chaperone